MRIVGDWTKDGHPHARNAEGTCRSCGASKHEYHYKLQPKETPVEPDKETTDLEYREAALRLAIQHFKAQHERPNAYTVTRMAAYFEKYLRTGDVTP